jgi:hypothetical protein
MKQKIDSVSQLLKVMRDGLYDKRQEAANELGNLAESSEDIVIALLVAKESDTYDDVKKAAASALEMPVHQRYILDHPEVIQKATKTVEHQVQVEKREVANNSGLRSWGIWAIIAGIVALVLPFFGYELTLFRVVSIGNPLCAGGLLVLGIILIVANQTIRPLEKVQNLHQNNSPDVESMTPEESEIEQLKRKKARELYKRKVFKAQGRCEICGKKIGIFAKLKGKVRCVNHKNV